MELVNRAIAVAFEQHADQKRMVTGAPYVVHLLEVARLLLHEGVSDEVLAAGILHDTLEDTSYTKEELLADFGEKVTGLVLFATEPENDEKKTSSEMRESWKRRKQHTIDACRTASADELLLAAADKLANLSSIREDIDVRGEDAVWKHFDSSKADQEWYYRSLATVFSEAIPQTRIYKLFLSCIDDVFS